MKQWKEEEKENERERGRDRERERERKEREREREKEREFGVDGEGVESDKREWEKANCSQLWECVTKGVTRDWKVGNPS
jgi:hypothetical protein